MRPAFFVGDNQIIAPEDDPRRAGQQNYPRSRQNLNSKD
jgi:hypothetical protein